MTRERVTWIRDGKNGKPRITHPWVYVVVGTDGTERHFDTAAEAREHYATPAGA